MKMKYFLMAAVLLSASLCTVSCGGDDDENDNGNLTQQPVVTPEKTAGMATGYYCNGFLASYVKRDMQAVVDAGDTYRFEQMKKDETWDYAYGTLAFHVVSNQTIEYLLEGVSISKPSSNKYYKVNDAPIPFYIYFDKTVAERYTYKLDGEKLTVKNVTGWGNLQLYYRGGAIVDEAASSYQTYSKVLN
jgi:hypothetical protein